MSSYDHNKESKGPLDKTRRAAKDAATTALSSGKGEAADKIEGMAETLHRASDHLRDEDMPNLASYPDDLANWVDRTARYLRETEPSRIASDLSDWGRKNPGLFLLGSVAAGFLGARFFRS